MTGRVQMPPNEQILAEMAEQDKMQARYYPSSRHSVQVDWLHFMCDLAQKVGVNPPIWKYLFTDWQLFKALTIGPSAPYQFRLVGPNQWSGAREAMLTVQERVVAPLKTNRGREKSKMKITNWSISQVWFLFSVVLVLGCILSAILLFNSSI